MERFEFGSMWLFVEFEGRGMVILTIIVNGTSC